MNLTVSNKSNFLSYFLNPVSRLSNSCIANLDSESISTIIAAADNTSILYAKYKANLGESDIKLNLPDLSRLTKIIQCINKDDFQLNLAENCLKYKDSRIQFKYHLLENNILTSPPISVDKIKALTFDTTFEVPYSNILDLIKTSTFAISLNKVYFYTKEGNVYAEVNDKQSHNVDSVCIKLCDSYTGKDIPDGLPISFETLRTIIGARCEKVIVNINQQLNVMTFNINNDESNLKYIVSGLIK
mgnify:FL=1